MPPKKKDGDASDEPTEINLPLSLYLSFAQVAGISLKPCGIDGQPLPGAHAFPMAGPCRVLCEDQKFASSCADSHAKAIAMAIELRRPYISNCHMRLAMWIVPILHNGRPLPAAIICGGTLLREADSALFSHAKRLAAEHGVDPADLVQSLGSTPILSRDRMRAIADFLFQMSAALASIVSPSETKKTGAPPVGAGTQTSLVFPPARRKESRKAKRKRALLLERQSAESEIVRLLLDRKPDAARETLVEMLTGDAGSPAGRAAASLDAAETFTRLFKTLAEGKKTPHGIADKQSILIAETLSQKASKKSVEALERSCAKFISISEEIVGEPRPRQVKAIQRFLEKNLAKKLTLGGVGKKFGLKEKALDALMRKHFQMGLSDYVASRRVSEAKRLLLSSDMTMGEIARQTGFKDQSYFTKVFKSRIGSTPTEFREKQMKV